MWEKLISDKGTAVDWFSCMQWMGTAPRCSLKLKWEHFRQCEGFYISAFTSTELNRFIIPGVSQGYTLLSHFVCSEVPWVSTGRLLCRVLPFSLSQTRKKRAFQAEKSTHLNSQSLPRLSRMSFFFLHCWQDTFECCILKSGSKDRQRCEQNL